MTKCLICGGIYPEDEITFHLESNANHWNTVEERGIWNCFEYLERSGETLASTEWSDYYEKALPYYGYIRMLKKEDKVVYQCTLHQEPILFDDATEMIEHCLKDHVYNEDTGGIIKHRMKEVILHNIRVKKGSTQRITEEDLEKYADEELKKLSIERELTGKQQSHAFDGYVEDQFSRLTAFIQNKDSICPLCNHDIDFMNLSDREKYIANKVIQGLKAGMKNLSKEDEKDFNKLVKRKYQGKIFDKNADLCLKCLLHLHTAHLTMLNRLVSENVLSGALPEYLASRKYQKEADQENLSTVLGKPTKVEDRQDGWRKPLLKWLKEGSH
jgi:predicted DCC family thiol-disulfide oxidoreductase YuxK